MTRAGAGREPLVLLSGMLGDASLWEEVTPRLAGRVLALPARIDLDDSVAAMAARVLADAPGRFALAGHSLGGIVALEVIRRTPHRVTRLAVLNASGRGPSPAQLAAWEAWRDRVTAGGFDAVAAELAVATLPGPRRAAPDLVARNERMARTVGGDGLLRQLAAQRTRPGSLGARGGLSGVGVPVLVLGGELDEVCPPPLQRELAAAFGRTAPDVTGVDGGFGGRGGGSVGSGEAGGPAELVILADAGHMTPIERPEAVAAELSRWLDRRS
ncbi:alpha/beta fold hydrolase [Streptosporangium oxazolinicum]|uniref:Alpha/beta fold hydrolase n=1 Tax=Streptosporangium oxazolinicum TaxID=909287 RepID=A0ABP8AIK3_9ACTN